MRYQIKLGLLTVAIIVGMLAIGFLLTKALEPFEPLIDGAAGHIEEWIEEGKAKNQEAHR